MPRLALVLPNLAATVLLLGACGGSPSSAPTLAPTTSTAATPTTTPTTPATPTPPPMPEAARAHTKAGAIAFVKHYWDIVNYAQETLDVKPLRRLSFPSCAGCNGGIRSITQVARKNGAIHGGVGTIRTPKATYYPGTAPVMLVTCTVFSTPERVTVHGATTVRYPGGSTPANFWLAPTPTGWKMSTLEERK